MTTELDTTALDGTADEADAQVSVEETASHRALALLAQHRMIATPQMHQLLWPTQNRRATSEILTELREDRFASYTVLPRAYGARAWFLTSRGARVVAGWPELRGRTVKPPLNATEASLRTAHTLTVLRAHLAFLADARRRGDDYGPLDWMPEVSHRLPDTGGEDKLIADAVMYYTAPATANSRRLQFRAFIEVDRATMSSERLSRKLIAYARFHDYTPQPAAGRRGTVADQGAMYAWQRFYPRFPRLLFVLTGTGEDGLRLRINDLRAMVASHPLVTQMAGQIKLAAAVLEDLEQSGPSAEVWTPLAGPPDPRSWMEL